MSETPTPSPRRRPRAGPERKTVNLALQGGGAHGAFTWGALDRLLEDERIEIEGITATSAGAMNAAALKSGYVDDGRAGARRCLEAFWLRVADFDGFLPDEALDWFQLVLPSPAATARALELNPLAFAADTLLRILSPYQLNPANHNPMRPIVEEMFDYGHVCNAAWPKLFICATNVRSGKIRVFSGAEITPDAILASACLPTLSQAVEIPDPKTGVVESYWDGGYSGNPALFPLFYNAETTDTIIVHINPIRREDVPKSATEIANRINEISFNATLLRELRAIDFVHRLIEAGKISPGAMKDVRIHSVGDDALMNQLGVATKLTPNKRLMLQLRDAGRAAMESFLDAHWDDLGVRSSVDLRAMFS